MKIYNKEKDIVFVINNNKQIEYRKVKYYKGENNPTFIISKTKIKDGRIEEKILGMKDINSKEVNEEEYLTLMIMGTKIQKL